MYKITVNKVIYTKTTRGTHKDFIRILTTETTESNLTKRIIELAHVYKEFNYNIDFVKI